MATSLLKANDSAPWPEGHLCSGTTGKCRGVHAGELTLIQQQGRAGISRQVPRFPRLWWDNSEFYTTSQRVPQDQSAHEQSLNWLFSPLRPNCSTPSLVLLTITSQVSYHIKSLLESSRVKIFRVIHLDWHCQSDTVISWHDERPQSHYICNQGTPITYSEEMEGRN